MWHYNAQPRTVCSVPQSISFPGVEDRMTWFWTRKYKLKLLVKHRLSRIKVPCRPTATVGEANWGCSCSTQTSNWTSPRSPGFLMLFPANENVAGTLRQAYSRQMWDFSDRGSEWSLLVILSKLDHSLKCTHQVSFSLIHSESDLHHGLTMLPSLC